jgi:hypothetical protein
MPIKALRQHLKSHVSQKQAKRVWFFVHGRLSIIYYYEHGSGYALRPIQSPPFNGYLQYVTSSDEMLLMQPPPLFFL